MEDKDPIRFITTAETFAKAIISSGEKPVPETMYDQYITALMRELDGKFCLAYLYPKTTPQYMELMKRIYNVIEETYQYGLLCNNANKLKETLFLVKTLGAVRLAPPADFNFEEIKDFKLQ